ncbi:MAG: FHA domain-containing protein, partial [Thermoguttaceae bacterium]
LGEEDAPLREIRAALVERRLEEVEQLLQADNPRGALDQLDRLERRTLSTPAVRVWRQVARRQEAAGRFTRQGRFDLAEGELTSALALRPGLAVLETRRQQCRVNGEKAQRLGQELHGLLAKEDRTAVEWSEVLAVADSLLAIAPDHSAAQQARRRAWKAVGMKVTCEAPRQGSPARRRPADVSTHANNGSPKVDTVANKQQGMRFLMWVDRVGGFLVCRGEQIVLGQPHPEGQADVPIVADVSRRHAVIRRDESGYTIEPIHAVKVDGRTVGEITLLADGNEIELGSGLRLRFRKPHALSSTARLELISHHKTEPPVDAVLLMAESCVLGPNQHSHVPCSRWQHDVILHGEGDSLRCHTHGTVEVDGHAYDSGAPVTYDSQIEGDDFAMRLEAI